jgi:soluble lytic murein transglycosylase-like protein
MQQLTRTGRLVAIIAGVVCLSVLASAQPGNSPTPQPSARAAGEKLVDAIILVESQGNAQRVGSHGERGLMQIRLATWREVTQKVFGRPQPFQKAFEPALNRRVGQAYLAQLQTQLGQHRAAWQSDERSLLIAAYNAGPTLLSLKRFDVNQLPASTRDYVQRVSNLHDAMLAELARAEQQRQATVLLVMRGASAAPVARL